MASKTSTPTKSRQSVSMSTSITSPIAGTSSPRRGGRSPSPARITRQQEKEQLQNLNDRLAAYIDKVRFLENENSRLSVQVKSTEEVITREVTSIKSLYETELEDARKVLDETAKEKTRLHLEVGKYKELLEDYKLKFHKSDRDCKDLGNENAHLVKENSDLASRCTNAESAKQKLDKENMKLRADIAALEKQLDTCKKQLEDETLLRVDTQNKLQTLKEEADFNKQLHAKELNETRTRVTKEYEEVDSRVREDYDSKLQEALQNMRADQEDKISEVRMEVEMLYEKKIEDVQSALDRSMNASSNSAHDLIIIRRRVDDLTQENADLKSKNAGLQARVDDMKNQLAREQEDYLERLGFKDQEISNLRQSLEDQTHEYADLLDVKLRLDAEITAYRKLLEGEEDRLNLSQTDSPAGGSNRKRKRVALSDTLQEYSESLSDMSATSTATGSVEIKDADKDGNFVQLYNKSDEDISIGGWHITQTAGSGDNAETTNYKFHRSLILKANSSCNIWSAGVGQTHKPPTDLVMKGQKWVTSGSMKTVLFDKDDVEVASRELSKIVRRSTTFRSSRGQDDVDSAQGSGDRCVVM